MNFLHDLAAFPRDLKLLAVALFLWGAGDTLFFYVVPLYLQQLGATPVQIGNVFSLSALAVAGTITVFGTAVWRIVSAGEGPRSELRRREGWAVVPPDAAIARTR